MAVSDYHDLMPDTVTHKVMTGRDAYQKPTFGAGTDFKARVLFRQRWVRAADGTEKLSRGTVWIGATPVIDPEDEITLPDGSTPPILVVERIPDEKGIHHVKIFFG